jgi:uncharacterized protein (TIGR02596 family)
MKTDATLDKCATFHIVSTNQFAPKPTMSTRLPSHQSKRAFSLIELLVVISIIAIIGAFAVPAAGQLLKGSSLSQAANALTDQTAAARQYALTRNRTVEVRFYSFIDPEDVGVTTPYYRAMQFFEIADGGVPNPVGKFIRFANTIVMNPDPTLSNLLQPGTNGAYPKLISTPLPNDPDLPRGVARNYTYIAFRFQPDGSTSLSLTAGTPPGLWFVTVHLLSDLGRANGGTPPPNFFTWMIDPVSGGTKVLRPGVTSS